MLTALRVKRGSAVKADIALERPTRATLSITMRRLGKAILRNHIIVVLLVCGRQRSEGEEEDLTE